jgi:hypothetical protein
MYTNGYEEASITTGNSVRAFGAAGELGALFQYAIPNVTLARQKSAMLPIVTDTVRIERLSIYNASVLPNNPLNGVRLKNTTGKHLLQGPVTVLDKNAYAGDAQIDNVPPGQERLLSYGIDLETVIDNSTFVQSDAITTARIAKGALFVERKYVSARDYRIDNKSTHEKTVLIEHPLRAGWLLTGTIKPVETLPGLDRFEVTAPAGRVTVVPIREEFMAEQAVTMLPADVSSLLTYQRTGAIPAAVRDAIGRAIELKESVTALESQVVGRTSQIDDITHEQERIRENMKTVEAKSQYYDRLLTKLNDQESAIERLQKERDDLILKRDAQQKALADYLSTLTVG